MSAEFFEILDICRIYNKEFDKYIFVLSGNLYLMEEEHKSINKQIKEGCILIEKGKNENR